MIEKIILDYIKNNIDIHVPVYMEVPEKYTLPMVVIEKTGSDLIDHVHEATIAVQCYADSLFNAASLNEQLKEIMLNLIELDKISRCSLNSDYNYPDVERKLHRYQAVFNVTYLK